MVTKQDLLESFNKDQLKDICREFELDYYGKSKSELIDAIDRKRSITKEFLQKLRNADPKRISDKLSKLGDDFYHQHVKRRFDELDEAQQHETQLLTSYIFSPNKELETLSNLRDELNTLGDFDASLEDYEEKVATKNQLNAYTTAKKHCYYKGKFLNQRLSSLKESTSYKQYQKLQSLDGDYERIYHYLRQGRLCYEMSSYDASIVMNARAIEFAIKAYLQSKSIELPDNTTLGPLIGKMREHNVDENLIDKVIEVQQFDRNICAHDGERKKLGETEANHSWTAVKMILRDLIDIDI